MPHPITPQDLASLPEAAFLNNYPDVILAVNDLIERRHRIKGGITINFTEVLNLLPERDREPLEKLFDMLAFEDAYRASGWRVTHVLTEQGSEYDRLVNSCWKFEPETSVSVSPEEVDRVFDKLELLVM